MRVRKRSPWGVSCRLQDCIWTFLVSHVFLILQLLEGAPIRGRFEVAAVHCIVPLWGGFNRVYHCKMCQYDLFLEWPKHLPPLMMCLWEKGIIASVQQWVEAGHFEEEEGRGRRQMRNPGGSISRTVWTNIKPWSHVSLIQTAQCLLNWDTKAKSWSCWATCKGRSQRWCHTIHPGDT